MKSSKALIPLIILFAIIGVTSVVLFGERMLNTITQIINFKRKEAKEDDSEDVTGAGAI